MASKDRHITLFVVSRFEFRDSPGKGFELRVAHVVSADGKSRGAEVQKVYFYENGAKTIMKGLQAKDFAKLKEHWPDVKHHLENPGPVPPLPEPEPIVEPAPLSDMGLGAAPMESAPLEQTEF